MGRRGPWAFFPPEARLKSLVQLGLGGHRLGSAFQLHSFLLIKEFMAVGGREDDVTEEERKRPTENG